MKNKITLACITILFGGLAQAQVGINTQNPAATLDIVAKNATGQSILPDGLLVPRVDRERALSMNIIATSTLIYVNSVATGTQTGKAVNIDTVGYYYFDGTSWIKFNSGTLTDNDTNIYNGNGTLTGNRTVTQNTNTLAFTGSANNAFSVDGNSFSVDAANNRVGIGTTAPSASLEINSGNSNVSGLKFSNLTSDSPLSNGATLGVDSYGNVVTVPGNAFTPATGREVLTGASISIPEGNIQVVLTFTLPTAGTYLVTYSVRGQIEQNSLQSGIGYATSFLAVGTGTSPTVSNTEILLYNGLDELDGGTGTGTAVITVTSPTTYTLVVAAKARDCAVRNNTNGRTSVSYVKITP
jgi:hypothetical protein